MRRWPRKYRSGTAVHVSMCSNAKLAAASSDFATLVRSSENRWLTAAKLVGEAAGVTRFKSEAAFARHCGVAPIPVWSGNTAGRVRMTRSGNRQLNAALHRIAVTQIRLNGLGQTYYRRRLAAGDSNPEALRCLTRRLSRVVFSHLHTDHQNRTQPCQPAAA